MAKKVSGEELSSCCDPSFFTFNTTNDILPLEGTIGQERALKALDFGLDLNSAGFNIYILGDSGTGKMTTITNILEKKAKEEPVPDDWCYVYNYSDPDVPEAISLPAGTGSIFQRDMDGLVKILKVEIPKAFESKEYEKQKTRIFEEFQQKQKEYFSELELDAQSKSFSIRKTVSGLIMVPVKKGGEPLTGEDYEALDENTRARIEAIGKQLQEKLDDVTRLVREEEKRVKERLNKLEREAALAAVGHLIDELKSKYRTFDFVLNYLNNVQEDILEHLDDFKPQEQADTTLPFLRPPRVEPSFQRYSVNVLVNNAEAKGAPVVVVSNPTYYNLFGRVEHKVQFGIAMTDFTMIKAGALHRANGGYIVINALDLLKNLFAYDALKRTIRNGSIKIEDVWEQYRLVSTVTLRPEAIPLSIKVVLVGSPYLYYLLYNLDEEYRELFKVKADFDNRMDRTKGNMHRYASFIATRCKEEKLLPFDRTGIAKVVEYGSRLAGHQEKLSAKFSDISDLLREAHYWATINKSPIVKAEHVEMALTEKILRNNKIEERLREMIKDGTIIVDVAGSVVGQVNGLAVIDIGDYSFGKPSRITAKTYAGKAGVVNIERETKMSGKIHEKAILTLSAYLGGKYAQNQTLSLSASIAFEQLYEEIEGDSATCAETYALLSSIAAIPLKQGIAVTGSMDQHGDVQPIGGVNEKIEGFFEVCKINGLNREQGVIIPGRNLKHLMLKAEVIDAVKQGMFHIYAIDNVEEGMEILCGMPKGELQSDGTYPEDTFNYLISKRLKEFSEVLKGKKGENEEEKSR